MKTKIILRLFALIVFAQPLYAAQMSQEEAKKLAAQQQPQVMYNYLQAASNATQRIRNLFNYNRLHLLISGGLIANLLRATAQRTSGVPPTTEENLAFYAGMAALYTISMPEVIASSMLLDAIEKNNIEKVKSILVTGFIRKINRSPNMLVPFPPVIIPTEQPLPLTIAINNNRSEIIKLLLQHGAWVTKADIDRVQILPTDTPDIQNTKQTIKRLLEDRYKHQPIEHLYPQKIYKTRQEEQKKLRAQYAPTESIAAEALEELHKSMYGGAELGVTQNIMSIINEYLTPSYVEIPRVNRPFLPIAQPVEALEKKEQEEKQN